MDINVLPPDLFVARVPSAMRESVPGCRGLRRRSDVVARGCAAGPERAPVEEPDHPERPRFPPRHARAIGSKTWTATASTAHVVYGPPLSLPIPDLEVRAACLRAYNDWAADFNRADPNRLVVLALLPSHTPEAATAELARVAALGHRGAIVDFLAGDDPAFEDSWESFWATANELAMPISFHLGKGMHSIEVKPGSWRMAAGVAVSPMQLDEVITGMILSGLLERYPNVRVVFGEAGLGWVPYLLERLDHEYEKYRDLIHDVVDDAPARLLPPPGVPHLRRRQPRHRAAPSHRRDQRVVGVGLSARRQHVAALA